VLAAAVWLQGVRRLFAAWWFAGGVVRNGAETGMGESPDSRNEQQEMPVRTRSTRWLAWLLYVVVLALVGLAAGLWLVVHRPVPGAVGYGYWREGMITTLAWATVGG
jgi:hypothetical protein